MAIPRCAYNAESSHKGAAARHKDRFKRARTMPEKKVANFNPAALQDNVVKVSLRVTKEPTRHD